MKKAYQSPSLSCYGPINKEGWRYEEFHTPEGMTSCHNHFEKKTNDSSYDPELLYPSGLWFPLCDQDSDMECDITYLFETYYAVTPNLFGKR